MGERDRLYSGGEIEVCVGLRVRNSVGGSVNHNISIKKKELLEGFLPLTVNLKII